MTPRDETTTPGHEHTDRMAKIIVNTRPQEWSEETISFDELLTMTYPGQPLGEGEDVTVSFSRGHDHKQEGSLTAGHSIKVKNKMVFDVYRTARS